MIYWIALSIVNGVGLTTKHKLLQVYKTPEEIFRHRISKKDFPYLKNDVDFTINKDDYLKSAEEIATFCEKENVDILTFVDKKYPNRLKGINQAPLVLYSKGNSEILSKRCVAIVGTREPSANGEKDAEEISAGLSQSGFVIVSGLAKGVDTIAHTSALNAGGQTVAVIATGINEITPLSNIGLSKRILENGGAVITEQVPGKLSFAPNFVMRNRIISGLSECSIIISAPEKSGSLKTAEFAQQQGRKVLVATGTRSDEKYEGSNKLLLKKNVAPALKINGIISYINGTQETEQIGIFDVPTKPLYSTVELPKQQGELHSFLNKEPISLESLSQKSGIDIDELAEILLDLELNGEVIQDMTGGYRLAKSQ